MSKISYGQYPYQDIKFSVCSDRKLQEVTPNEKISSITSCSPCNILCIYRCISSKEKVGFVDEMAVLQQFPKFKQAQQQIEAIGKKKSETAKAAFDKETDERKRPTSYRPSSLK